MVIPNLGLNQEIPSGYAISRGVAQKRSTDKNMQDRLDKSCSAKAVMQLIKILEFFAAILQSL